MLHKINIRALAKKDLKDISVYSLSNWGEEKAAKYYYKITDTIKSLASNTHLGAPCDYIKEGYRKYHVNKHYIFYKLTKDTVYIIRVLSDKMDYSSHL